MFTINDFTGSPTQAATAATFLFAYDNLLHRRDEAHWGSEHHLFLHNTGCELMAYGLGLTRDELLNEDSPDRDIEALNTHNINRLMASLHGVMPYDSRVLVVATEVPDITQTLETVVSTHPESFCFFYDDALTTAAGWSEQQAVELRALSCNEGRIEYGDFSHTFIRLR